jgi:flagellar M-ring protein FliF
MSDFFSQLITQIRDIWVRFNTLQKVIVASVFAVTFLGLVLTIAVSSVGSENENKATLFANLDLSEAASITNYLKESNFSYDLENEGRSIVVPRNQVHEIRMELARNGLPGKGGKGYELFDEVQLGITDFVQNLNYRRAVEVELKRSIETLSEVDAARVHITIPKETIFMEAKEEARASVVLKLHPGDELTDKQVRGMTHLVSSAVVGLKARQVSVLDQNGNLLTRGYAEDAVAEHTDHNMELSKGVEKYLEKKVVSILSGVLGPNKARVKVNAELDFDQVQKRVESYDPQKKVVRSEQRDDGTRKNSPAVGDEVKEGSITNYEIDRTVANVINSPGMRKRITVSVAVDGTYEAVDGKQTFKPRGEDELKVLTRLVKNAVGYSEARTDEVYVASIQFDNSFMKKEIEALESASNQELYKEIVHWSMIFMILVAGFLAIRRVIRDIAGAMNPPLPRYAGIDLELEDEAVSEDVTRQNELVERMEMLTRDHPDNVAELIRSWLQEGESTEKKKKK